MHRRPKQRKLDPGVRENGGISDEDAPDEMNKTQQPATRWGHRQSGKPFRAGIPADRTGPPYQELENSAGHERGATFFSYMPMDEQFMNEPPEKMSPESFSFPVERSSPGRQDIAHTGAMSSKGNPGPSVDKDLFQQEEPGAGSHLGFLSDAAMEPSLFALMELAKENLALKLRLRAVNAEVSKLQDAVKALESERGRVDHGEKKNSQSRYWTEEEHRLFLEAIHRFGPKDMKAIAKHVGSRSSTQVRTHAQKYFLKLARDKKQHDGGSSSNSATEESFGGGTSQSDSCLSAYHTVPASRWSSSPGEGPSSGGDDPEK